MSERKVLYMSTWNVTDARANLPRILQLVEAGEEITLARYGRPVAVIVRPDALRTRRSDDALQRGTDISLSLRELADRVVPEGRLSADRAEAYVTEIRADRDRG